MNNLAKQIQAILSRAESDLRGLIAEAAKSGDYQGVDSSRTAASRIGQMILEISSEADKANPAVAKLASHTGLSPEVRTKARAKKSEYPRFFVRKGVLYKVGWSKKDKKEYVHKIPKDAFDRTIAAMASLAESDSTLITSEQIVERTEHNGTPVPIYQVYLALALFRDRGLVNRQGREGYAANSGFKSAAGKLWEEFQMK